MKKPRTSYNEPTEEEKEEIRTNLRENPLTTKDYWAIVISMIFVLLPRILLIMGAIVGILWFFFIR